MPTTALALHCSNQLSATRFESPLQTLDRWGHGSSNPRFLRRRPRNGWKRRGLEQAISAKPQRVRPAQPSLLRQGLEVGLFGTYMLIFLASLWVLG
ncbi:hypothetical protein JST97_25785 [bacterium]|nr:hypothetical protein [bacterium]